MYYDGAERLRSLPASWTDVVVPDSVIGAGQGHAHFRADDLLSLLERLHELLNRFERKAGGVK